MKKSYFRHDYNARNDIKLQSVITKYGAVGIGVYWIIVEMLYQNGGELPLDIARNISVAYSTDFKVVESVINDFDLFENDGNVFWSVRIRQAIDNTKKVSDARKAASRQRWSRKQEKPENPESRKTASHPPAKEELSLFPQPEEQKPDIPESRKTASHPPAKEELSLFPQPEEQKPDIPDNVPEEVPKQEEQKKRTYFKPPTVEEVAAYVKEKGYSVDAEQFVAFYESKGWMIGKNKMQKWRAAVATWQRKQSGYSGGRATTPAQQSLINKNCNDEWN